MRDHDCTRASYPCFFTCASEQFFILVRHTRASSFCTCASYWCFLSCACSLVLQLAVHTGASYASISLVLLGAVGGGEDYRRLRIVSVGDPRLCPVQHPLIAVQAGSRSGSAFQGVEIVKFTKQKMRCALSCLYHREPLC